MAVRSTYWQNCCAVCQQPDSFWITWPPIIGFLSLHLSVPELLRQTCFPLCHGEQGCNNSKGYSDPHEWLARRYGVRKAAKIKKTIATYFTKVAEAFPSGEGKGVLTDSLQRKGA